jgi:hypothetical protein
MKITDVDIVDWKSIEMITVQLNSYDDLFGVKVSFQL